MQLAGRLQLLALCALIGSKSLAAFDHSQWDDLLKRHVVVLDAGATTRVDYDGMLAQRELLRAYLDALSGADRGSFESWSSADQLAFLINAYNAWTVELILTEYPDLDSIRDIGFLFNTAWRRPIVSLFGEQVSLDDVEHGMIREWDQFREPRIHFAVNCAAVGCPALRPEAYVGSRLDAQLEDNTRLFLADRTRNYQEDGRLYVSRIFSWYREDFESGWQGIDSLETFLAAYAEDLGLDSQALARLRAGDMSIRFLRYDWALNRL